MFRTPVTQLLSFTSGLEASPLRWDHFYLLSSAEPIKRNGFINTKWTAVKAERMRGLKGAVVPMPLLCSGHVSHGCHVSRATEGRACVLLQGQFSLPVNLERWILELCNHKNMFSFRPQMFGKHQDSAGGGQNNAFLKLRSSEWLSKLWAW